MGRERKRKGKEQREIEERIDGGAEEGQETLELRK